MCFAGARGSSIKSLDVPLVVRNGTGPVDLACVYEIDDNENGLVIKWFHEAYQIYQWIPPSNLHPRNLIITYMSVIRAARALLNLLSSFVNYIHSVCTCTRTRISLI